MIKLLAAAALFAAGTTLAAAQPAPAPAKPGEATCTDVQVGSAASYDCLNAQLHALAGAEPKPSSLDAPLSAASPGYQTGAANAAATANRLGSNYGKSATAARPSVSYPSGIPR